MAWCMPSRLSLASTTRPYDPHPSVRTMSKSVSCLRCRCCGREKKEHENQANTNSLITLTSVDLRFFGRRDAVITCDVSTDGADMVAGLGFCFLCTDNESQIAIRTVALAHSTCAAGGGVQARARARAVQSVW